MTFDLTLKTDKALLARLRAAAVRPLTTAEVRAQRISNAASCSDLPRHVVAQIVDRLTGHRS
jgi:hypothetical protein